jgi:hypothetical protein
MKVIIQTPSGKRVEFGPDEEVRLVCIETGTYRIELLGDDDRVWHMMKNHTQHNEVISTLPANRWKAELMS